MRNFLLIAVLLSSVRFQSIAWAHQLVKVHAGSDLAHAKAVAAINAPKTEAVTARFVVKRSLERLGSAL